MTWIIFFVNLFLFLIYQSYTHKLLFLIQGMTAIANSYFFCFWEFISSNSLLRVGCLFLLNSNLDTDYFPLLLCNQCAFVLFSLFAWSIIGTGIIFFYPLVLSFHTFLSSVHKPQGNEDGLTSQQVSSWTIFKRK